MSYDNFFDKWEKQQKALDRIANGTSFFDKWEKQQKALDRIANGTSFFDEWEQREKALDRIANGTSFIDEWEQHQKVLDRIANGTSFIDRFEQHQKALDRIVNGTSFIDRFEQHQKVLDRIANGTSFIDRFEQHQKALDRIANGTSFIDRFEQQQKAIEKVLIKPISATFQKNNFQYGESLVIMDSVFSDMYNDLERNHTQDEFLSDFQLWIMSYIAFWNDLVKDLQKGYNVIDTKKAKNIFLELIAVVGFIITLETAFTDDTPEIHIHNEYEEVEIQTNTKENRTDIYIEKKNAPRQDDSQEGWYSGGDRT